MMPDKQTIYEYLVSNATDKLTEYLIKDYGLSLADALDKVYRSHTFELLQIPEAELYVQSPAYIYEIFVKEIEGRILPFHSPRPSYKG